MVVILSKINILSQSLGFMSPFLSFNQKIFITLRKFCRLILMRNKIIFFALCISVALNVFSQGSAIYFTENQQQWDSKILFRSQLYQGYVFLEKNCLTYYFLSEENSNHHHATASLSDEEMEQSLHRFLDQIKRIQYKIFICGQLLLSPPSQRRVNTSLFTVTVQRKFIY